MPQTVAPIIDQNGWNQWSKHVLKELERLNDNIEGTRHEIATIKTEINSVKSMQYTIDELKAWKKSVDDISTPSQIKAMKDEIDSLKNFKIVSTTAFAIIQIIMGLVIAFKNQIFK